MAAFHFELVSPEKLLFSGDVEAVGVPGAEGDFQMLKGHAPLMSMLRPGVVTVPPRLPPGRSGRVVTVPLCRSHPGPAQVPAADSG